MRYVRVTLAQGRQSIGWIASGFDQLIARLDCEQAPASDLEQYRSVLRRYKDEFIRILKGEVTDDEGDLPELPLDISRLMRRGCPPLDIVELMLGATSGLSPCFDDLLISCGLTRDSLSDLRRTCEATASIISMLE